MSSIPILMYHRIARLRPGTTVPGHYVHPRAFRRQMVLLGAMGYRPIALDRIGDEDLPEKPIVITFDDGYLNFYEHALPVLRESEFPATVFLVAQQIGGSNTWDEKLGDVHEPLMTIDHIEEAMQHRIGFGSHTLSHADLAALDQKDAWHEIAESRSILGKALGKEVDTFCYPYGRKTPAVMRMVAEAGYRMACSTEKGMNTAETDPYALRRINIRRDTALPVFLAKLLRGARS